MQTSDANVGAVSILASLLKTLAEEGRAMVSPAPLGTKADDALVVVGTELALEVATNITWWLR